LSALSFRDEFLRALGGSTGVYLFGTAMAFLVGVQLARGLGVAGYGLYGSAMAAASLGANIASGGLKQHATRDLAAYRAQGDHQSGARLIGWSARYVLLIGAAAALAVGAYVVWGLKGSVELAGVTMVVTALMALLALAGAILCGADKLVLGQALETAIRPTTYAVLLWIALLAFGSIEPGLAMTLTVAAIVLTLPFGLRTVWRLWQVKERGSVSEADQRRWRKASATMGMTSVLFSAEAAIPLIVVGALSTLEQAGLFRVASAITVFTNMPVSMILAMVPAMTASLYKREEFEKLRRLTLVAAFLMLLPTLAIAGCLWIFGETLLTVGFGNDYRAAWPIMSVLAGASVVNAVAGASIGLLHAARHDAVVARAFGVSLAVTCAGLLIAAWEGKSVVFAMAVLAGMLARTVFLIVATYRLVGIDPTIFGVFRREIRHPRDEG
jgi:O-antigen/teichoic acid export membrane protein